MHKTGVIGLAVLLAGTAACGAKSEQARAKPAPIDTAELARRVQRLTASFADADSDAAIGELRYRERIVDLGGPGVVDAEGRDGGERKRRRGSVRGRGRLHRSTADE